MVKPRIIAIGEVLFDLLPEGDRPGGAPANFAFHAQSLGGEVHLVSRVGQDAPGRRLLDHLAAAGLNTSGVQVDARLSTGTARVAISKDGVPEFVISRPAAWDQIEASSALLARAPNFEAIYFGSLAQRSPHSRNSLRAFVSATRTDSLRVFDPNLRSPHLDQEILQWSIGAANVIKLSEEELHLLSPLFSLSGDALERIAQLGRSQNLKAVALTRGARGSILWTPTEVADSAGAKITVKDTVGAGDSYVAALTLGLLAQWSAAKIVQIANNISAYVCSQAGAMPPLPATLRFPFPVNP